MLSYIFGDSKAVGLTKLLTPSRKQQMMIQNRELEALQQKIREAEERLKNNGASANGFSQDGTPKRGGGKNFLRTFNKKQTDY